MKHSTQSEYWGRERARDGEGEREIESERERDDTFTLTHKLTLMHRLAYKKKLFTKWDMSKEARTRQHDNSGYIYNHRRNPSDLQ